MTETAADARPIERSFRVDRSIDALATISLLWLGPTDPQMRVTDGAVLRATRTDAGPATVRLQVARTDVHATAWGPGAELALESVPGLIGVLDDPAPLVPRHAVVAELVRRAPGLRMTRTGRVLEALVPSILGQKVTGPEQRREHAALIRRFGEAAPGPFGLMLPPRPESLATLPYWAFHPLGIERRRADAIRAASAVAPRLEAIRVLTPDEAMRRLRSLPGIGPWTAAETMRLALGDPDAVSVGDYHLPQLICSTLAGEPDGDDRRMLELLEPYRGQRARVALLIERGAMWGKRRAPRARIRSIATI